MLTGGMDGNGLVALGMRGFSSTLTGRTVEREMFEEDNGVKVEDIEPDGILDGPAGVVGCNERVEREERVEVTFDGLIETLCVGVGRDKQPNRAWCLARPLAFLTTLPHTHVTSLYSSTSPC